MSWEQVKLEDISISVQTGPFGAQLHQSDYSNEGIPVVMPKDIINGRIVEVDIARVSQSHIERLSRYVINEGDILYSRRGDVGRCAYVTKHENGWLCGTGCLKITLNQEIVDPLFVFYQLQLQNTVEWVKKHAVGATMLNLNTSILQNVPLRIPKLETQHRIADILSAYDDLIENNKKQIKLLEEAAQRLYKEWFVDLHFPGYENTKIIDGVPEGWFYRRVGDFGEVVTGKTPSTSKSDHYGKDVPFVTIPDMQGNVFPLKTEKMLSQIGADSQQNKYLPTDSVLVSCIATVGLVSIVKEVSQTNQQINAVILEDKAELYFFYETMKRIKVLLEGVGSNGATMTNVNKSKFSNIEVLYPGIKLVLNFNSFCEPLFNQIYLLSKSNLKLQCMRDELLVKIMNRDIEV